MALIIPATFLSLTPSNLSEFKILEGTGLFEPEAMSKQASSTSSAAPSGGNGREADLPRQVARTAGLRYVSDDQPGIRRQRQGRGFSFFDPQGNRIQDPEERERLKALAIPPAWEDVWICPFPNGHLLATGRDQKGRKQYRYHPNWRKVRNRNKFERMVAFAYARPLIREATDHDLRRRTLSREKLLALVVRLLDETLIRVGNDEYAQQNQSFGLTTLRDRHVEVGSTTVRFHFRGKSGVEHDIELHDRRLARTIKRCYEIPGHELFRYVDENGDTHTIGSADVNDYLRQITDEGFTAKDFRTWAGTAAVAQALEALGQPDSAKQAEDNIREAIKVAAQRLGNRVATCRNFYVHPTVLDAYREGWLLPVLQKARTSAGTGKDRTLTPEERGLVAVLTHDPVEQAA